MAHAEVELPGFVPPLQQAREAARREVFARVQQLTREGLHDEAHALWEREISTAGESFVA
jgi:hypothetical protein